MQSTGYRRRVRSRQDPGTGNVIEGQRIYCIPANGQGARRDGNRYRKDPGQWRTAHTWSERISRLGFLERINIDRPTVCVRARVTAYRRPRSRRSVGIVQICTGGDRLGISAWFASTGYSNLNKKPPRKEVVRS